MSYHSEIRAPWLSPAHNLLPMAPLIHSPSEVCQAQLNMLTDMISHEVENILLLLLLQFIQQAILMLNKIITTLSGISSGT